MGAVGSVITGEQVVVAVTKLPVAAPPVNVIGADPPVPHPEAMVNLAPPEIVAPDVMDPEVTMLEGVMAPRVKVAAGVVVAVATVQETPFAVTHEKLVVVPPKASGA